MLAVSTHFRFVGRYYFQVLPWIVYFATVAVLEVVSSHCVGGGHPSPDGSRSGWR